MTDPHGIRLAIEAIGKLAVASDVENLVPDITHRIIGEVS